MTSKTSNSLWLSYLPTEDSGLKTLYTKGKDHRTNLFEEEVSVEVKKQAQSVACLMREDSLRLRESKSEYRLKDVESLEERFGPHQEGTPFTNEKSAGFGTAFLVAPKLVLTAGHCILKEGTHTIDEDLVEKTRVVFGFQMQTQQKLNKIPASQVFKIRRVIHVSLKIEDGDWALLKLNRTTDNIAPLQIDFLNPIHQSIPIYMLGHPMGLPLKYTSDGRVVEKDTPQATKFEAEIDAFKGNSGSPVFNNATHQVIGILVGGNKDYSPGRGPRKLHIVTPEDIQTQGYEKCQRITALPDEVLELINPAYKETRQKAITDGQKVLKLIEKEETEKAIKILEPLAENGVQAASCALVALLQDASKINWYRKQAIGSGFFTEESLEEVGRFFSEHRHYVQNVKQKGKHAVNIQKNKSKYVGGSHKHIKK